MIPFKGRLSLKQYMPLKPVKRGIKVWECADSSNGFVCDLEVYTGKQRNGNPEQGLRHRVVRNLTRPLVGKNHHVFVNNFFNSLALAEDLLRDQIYICGTVCGNRQGIPRAIAPKTQRVKRLRRGESLFLRKENIVVTVWKDKKPVYFLSSQSDPLGNDTVGRRQRNGTVIQVPSTPVVKTYNNNMGGVDLSDQMRGYYMAGRKSKKWWRCLMWFFVDVSIVNAYILEKLSPHHRSRTQLAFRLDLVKLLIGNFSARRLSASSGRLEGGHWPMKFSKGRCKRCLKRNKETWCRMACELCGKRICLDCFKNHTADDLAWTLARNSKTRACKNLIFCNDFLKNWPPSRSKIALIILYHLFSSFNRLVRCSLSWNVTIFCEFMSNMDGFCWDFYSLNLSSWYLLNACIKENIFGSNGKFIILGTKFLSIVSWINE